jgi:hypothetical protein
MGRGDCKLGEEGGGDGVSTICELFHHWKVKEGRLRRHTVGNNAHENIHTDV